MQILLAVSKFNEDVPRIRYDQNRLAETQDKYHLIDTAHQIDLEVCFASTMTFFIENVSLDFTKSNEKVRKKICNALFKKIDFFHF